MSVRGYLLGSPALPLLAVILFENIGFAYCIGSLFLIAGIIQHLALDQSDDPTGSFGSQFAGGLAELAAIGREFWLPSLDNHAIVVVHEGLHDICLPA